MSTVTHYVMNPAEDTVMFGDELAEGMLVLIESTLLRRGDTEDECLRKERFCKVTRLRRIPASGDLPEQVVFIGEWVDGHLATRKYSADYAWIVKKDSVPRQESQR